MTSAENLARICKVLSVGTRVRIVQLLKDRTLCVGAISDLLNVTQGAVSQHLRILREADLVIPEKRGYYVHYRLNRQAVAKLKDVIGRFLEIRPPGRMRRFPQCGRKRRKTCAPKRTVAKSRKN